MIAPMLLQLMNCAEKNTPKQISKLIQNLEENGFCEKNKKGDYCFVIEKSVVCPINKKSTYKIELAILASTVRKTNGNPYFYDFSINLIDSKGSRIFNGNIYHASRERLARTCAIVQVILNSILDVLSFMTRFFGKPKYKNNQISFTISDFFIRYNTEEYLEVIFEFRKSGVWILIKPKDRYERRSYRKLSDIIDLDIEYIKTHYSLLFKRKIRHAINKTCLKKKKSRTKYLK